MRENDDADRDPDKKRRDRKEIEKAHRPDALILHEIIRREGEEELRRTALALALSAFAAGLSMGLTLIVPGVLKAALPDEPWAALLISLGYSVGFLVVVLGRQQLFTENTVTPILPLLQKRNAAMAWKVARLWAIVLLGNILATYVIAYVLVHADAFKPEVRAAFTDLSQHAIDGSFMRIMTEGVFSGWLIALMVWILPASGSAGPFIIVLMTTLVSLCGFTHVVAGSIDAFYLVILGQLGFREYWTVFFIPTLIGNLFGGVALVSVLNYGQVAPEVEEQGDDAGDDAAPSRKGASPERNSEKTDGNTDDDGNGTPGRARWR